ncbi:hypothetical protein C9419_15440 [Paraburkholderia fungorum]|jgi:hypothetical protein|nr:hypothetical protein C9419_15440 [Paraburkholderia fungorum]
MPPDTRTEMSEPENGEIDANHREKGRGKIVKRLIFWHNRRFSTIGKWLAPRCCPRTLRLLAGWLPPD